VLSREVFLPPVAVSSRSFARMIAEGEVSKVIIASVEKTGTDRHTKLLGWFRFVAKPRVGEAITMMDRDGTAYETFRVIDIEHVPIKHDPDREPLKHERLHLLVQLESTRSAR
jgi:hypothetical protein